LADLDSFARNGKIRMFSVDTLERNASKGHGLVTSVAAANNILLVGTIKGWLVHPDFAGTDSNGTNLFFFLSQITDLTSPQSSQN